MVPYPCPPFHTIPSRPLGCQHSFGFFFRTTLRPNSFHSHTPGRRICQSDKKCQLGHRKFDITDLRRWKEHHGRLLCLACKGGEGIKPKQNLTQKKNDGLLKCTMCSDSGTEKPLHLFSKQQRKKDANSQFHSCQDCENEMKRLQEIFRKRKSKCVCKCKDRRHVASNEKCPLFMTNQWPGMDFSGRFCVGEEQVAFLDRMPRTKNFSWWHLLWGRLCTR